MSDSPSGTYPGTSFTPLETNIKAVINRPYQDNFEKVTNQNNL